MQNKRMAEIQVRDIVESDYEEWLRLFDLYLDFYKTSLPEETKKATFQRALDPNTDVWSSLAIHPETNKPIGLANYLRHLSTWSTDDQLYLNDLYVDEDQRLKHVGRSLIEYVYAKGDEMGAPHVYWCTDMTNHRAQLLYCKVGSNLGQVIYRRPQDSYDA